MIRLSLSVLMLNALLVVGACQQADEAGAGPSVDAGDALSTPSDTSTPPDAPLFGARPPGRSDGSSASPEPPPTNVVSCTLDQAINPMAMQPSQCNPGEKCAIAGFTAASGMPDLTGVPAGCADANMDGMPDGTCEHIFACIPAGTVKTGEACSIDMQTGTDNCEPGDECQAISGSGATAKHMCVELCPAIDGDQSCAHLATDKRMPASTTHCFPGGYFSGTNVSACTVPCNLGDGTCTAPGTGCKLLIAEQEFMCLGVGTVAIGESCERLGTAGCVAEASCARTNANDPNSPSFCRRNCSDSRPCDVGSTCRTVPGVRNGGGTCQPQ